MQAFPEALEVAEALVLLPDVDAVTPGRQMYSRAAAQDLQVPVLLCFANVEMHNVCSFTVSKYMTG